MRESFIEFDGSVHDRYAMVPNEVFRSPELSGLAKAIYGLLCTHSPKFKVSTRSVVCQCKESRPTVMKAMNELIEQGWMERVQLREEGGKYVQIKYVVFAAQLRGKDSLPREEGWSKSFTKVGQESLPTVGQESLPHKKNNKNNTLEEHSPYKSPKGDESSERAKRKRGEYSPEFEQFWNQYPRRVAKQAAFNAWRRALKDGYEVAHIMDQCRGYSKLCEQQRTELTFIKHPATFINQMLDDDMETELASVEADGRWEVDVDVFDDAAWEEYKRKEQA